MCFLGDNIWFIRVDHSKTPRHQRSTLPAPVANIQNDVILVFVT